MARKIKSKKNPTFFMTKIMPWAIRGLIVVVFIISLVAIIGYARGYRFSFKDNLVVPTGILAITSSPNAAEVYVNGQLKGVTDLNLTLPADKYTIEVKKDGYTDWKEDVTLKGEIVQSLDAVLFPKNPSLSPLTNLGIIKAVPVDQTDTVMIFTQTGDTEKDGIYLFDANKKPLSLFPPLKLLVLKQNLPSDVDFSHSIVHFDPDFKQSIVEFPTATTTYAYLLTLDQDNSQPFDVSTSKNAILDAWNIDKNKEIIKILETFPKLIQPIASDSFHIISFSPDKTKMIYQAKNPLTLPRVIEPPLIGSNQNQEERTLAAGSLYLYDKKEDKNFNLPLEYDKLVKLVQNGPISPTETPTPTPIPRLTTTPVLNLPSSPIDDILPILWYPDSRHLGVIQQREIDVYDYDGTNKRVVYAGPFESNFFLVTKDSRLFVLTNLNPQYNQFPDMYEVGSR